MPSIVACIVLNGVVSDARVLKEARTLIEAGYAATIVGITGGEHTVYRREDGIPITLLAPALHTRNLAALNLMISIALAALAVLCGALVVGLVRGPAVFADALDVLARLADPRGRTFAELLVAGLVAVSAIAALWKRRVIANAVGRLRELLFYALYDYAGHSRQESRRNLAPALAQDGSHSRLQLLRGLLGHENRGWVLRLHGFHRAMYLHLRDQPIDIVHCHDFTTLPVGLALKRARPSLKLVYDSHELFSAVVSDNRARQAWVKRSEAAASTLIDASITVNDHIAGVLRRYYSRLPGPVVVCNATRLPEAAIAYDGRLHRAAEIPEERKILLYQGGFAPHRGLEALVLAAPLLDERWMLVMMGSGRHETVLRRLVERSATDRVRFIDAVPQAELGLWTAGGALGAIPYEMVSLNHLYCSPNKLWEYPRSGVPLLCSDAPEMAARVARHRIGWVIPADQLSPTGIAAIVNGISDDELAVAAGNCRAYIEAENWSSYESRLLGLYRGL